MKGRRLPLGGSGGGGTPRPSPSSHLPRDRSPGPGERSGGGGGNGGPPRDRSGSRSAARRAQSPRATSPVGPHPASEKGRVRSKKEKQPVQHAVGGTRVIEFLPNLLARMPGAASSTKVHLMVGGQRYRSSIVNSGSGKPGAASPGTPRTTIARRGSGGSSATAFAGLGADGNKFSCAECGEFGEIVCCDGCPRVFHHNCLPLKSPSRQALDRDDDPWYCPYCLDQVNAKAAAAALAADKKAGIHTAPSPPAKSTRHGAATPPRGAEKPDEATLTKSTRKSRQATLLNKCVDCQKMAQPAKGERVEPCSQCGSYVHVPPCHNKIRTKRQKQQQSQGLVLCITCLAVDAGLAAEEEEHLARREAVGSTSFNRKTGQELIRNEQGKFMSKKQQQRERKRQRRLQQQADSGTAPSSPSKDEADIKKVKKKQRREDGSSSPTPTSQSSMLQEFMSSPAANRTIGEIDDAEAAAEIMEQVESGDIDSSHSEFRCSGDKQKPSADAAMAATLQREAEIETSVTPPPGSKRKRKAAKEHDDDEEFVIPGGVTSDRKRKKKKKKKDKKRGKDGIGGSPMGIEAAESFDLDSPEGPTGDHLHGMDHDHDDDDDDDGLPFSLSSPKEQLSQRDLQKLLEPTDYRALGLAPATPAFYFFLGENRWKIEKALARSHRTFTRMPRGSERNALVAREAGLWWTKLREQDHKRYMSMSMRDFEQKIIEWKEEKSLKEMGIITEPSANASAAGKAEAGALNKEDPMMRYEEERLHCDKHERLYLSTSVGSKVHKLEPSEQSYNRVLLDLLHDNRFHPLPMLGVNRFSETGEVASNGQGQQGEATSDKATSGSHVGDKQDSQNNRAVTMPHFDVHGPIATSVGDECLGCNRGWTHYCSVLQRRIPAVEPRAKLQPPLSSLMATRVGLGLRPRLERYEPKVPSDQNSKGTLAPLANESNGAGDPMAETGSQVNTDSEFPLEWRESTEQERLRTMPTVIPSCSLSHPSDRADDIAHFIEETLAMKVPEPLPRPQPPAPPSSNSKKSSGGSRNKLPTTGATAKVEESDEIYKCGRCRTIIYNDTGCVQCRRAQLVINTTKKVPGERDSVLKVQTVMLGRVHGKPDAHQLQQQSAGDIAVSHAMLKQRWAPCVILPPQTEPQVPHPKSDAEDGVEDDDSSARESEGAADDSHRGSDSGEADKQEDRKQGPGGETREKQQAPAGQTQPAPPGGMASKTTGSQRTGSTGRPHRAARDAASAGIFGSSYGDSYTLELQDRDEICRQNKKRNDSLHKKCLNIACCAIILALQRRDPLRLFAEPVQTEGYAVVVKKPIDFSTIKRNILDEKYATLGSFASDIKLLCDNALQFNPAGSIYAKTATELSELLVIMQKRAGDWMGAILDAQKGYVHQAKDSSLPSASGGSSASHNRRRAGSSGDRRNKKSRNTESSSSTPAPTLLGDEPCFDNLKQRWPEAIDFLQKGQCSGALRRQVQADFMRTRENEMAFYGNLAVRRVAAAAAASLAPYTDSGASHSVVPKRNFLQDEALRRHVDKCVAELTASPILVQLKDVSTWREEAVVKMLRKVQTRRLERRWSSDNGCARCDPMETAIRTVKACSNVTLPGSSQAASGTKTGKQPKPGSSTGKEGQSGTGSNASGNSGSSSNSSDEDGLQRRVDPSRMFLTTGLGSAKTCQKIVAQRRPTDEEEGEEGEADDLYNLDNVCVSVRGSKIHGWGMFADQPFNKGDVVAEYVGEYVDNDVADVREREYQARRIQDYLFRVDDKLVIDATLKGGNGRYINHNCTPNCYTKIVPANSPGKEDLKRVLIIAQRPIEINEEIHYDYQFPLELELQNRIPCNCGSDACRGFMNWDIPEKGSRRHRFKALLVSKRGANMRDRIRRLERPLKSEMRMD